MLQIFGDVLSILSGVGTVRSATDAERARLSAAQSPVWRRPADMPRLG